MGQPDRPRKSTDRQPTLQIIGIYLLIGGVWVLAASKLLFQKHIDPSHLPVLHTLEGWTFLLGTAVLFYFLISRYLRAILRREEKKIDALVSDISVQRHLVEALDQAREHYRLLFEQMAQGVVYLDGDGQILAVNPAAEKILGISSADLLGRTSIDPEGKALHTDGTPLPVDQSPFHQALVTGKEVRDMIVGLYNPIEGDHRWVSIDAVPQLIAGESRPFQVLATLNDITERRQAEEKVQNLAFYDSLTGLPNRRLLRDRLGQALAQARRERTLVGMAFLDLDGFKTINDTLGHASGDTLLQEVSGRLQETVRGSDTVARLGGDEFVVLLNNLENADVAATVAEKILSIFASPFLLGESEIFSTASIGLALYPLDANCEEDLLRRADMAMYRAKERGRNQYQFYAPQMNNEAMQRLELNNALNLGLRRNELMLFFQEKTSLKTGGIIGVEALLRWHHPERGLLLPAEFLPLAEESGLILPIGEWVLRSACTQAGAWQRMGLPQLRISINVSTRQLRHKDLVEMVRRELAEAGLLPTSLDLEIREESLLEEQAQIPETLAALKEMGVGCTLDDFGTGLSAIGRLRSYPVDRIKIHQSLIQDFAAAENAGLIQGIVDLAHSLHLQVVAEGVETDEQKTFLQNLGCDEVQGFHFRRPVPAEELTEFLGRRRSG